jgi:hypothetical protein
MAGTAQNVRSEAPIEANAEAPIEAHANAPIEANAEAIQAWDGPLYDRFVRFRELVTTGLGAHGEAAL